MQTYFYSIPWHQRHTMRMYISLKFGTTSKIISPNCVGIGAAAAAVLKHDWRADPQKQNDEGPIKWTTQLNLTESWKME